MRAMDFVDCPSPNFDERALPVTMIVLHYTGMPDCQGALDRMTSPEAKVSAHYCVDEDGTVYKLVDETKRAWHQSRRRACSFCGTLRAMLPWMHAELDEIDAVFGGDPWPYGVEPNRPTLDALVRYLAEQGVIAKPPRVDDLFVPVRATH